MSYAECSIEGCQGAVEARGWCNPHYQRWYAYGDPEFHPPTPEEKFWSRVEKSDGCWLWTGPLHSGGKTGYGWTGKKLAHRQAYEYAVGPIPDGLQLDHLCRVRLCVRPEHLEPVTQKENIRRGDAPSTVAARTGKCQRGHLLSGRNLYVVPATGAHRCQACVNDRQRKNRRSRA